MHNQERLVANIQVGLDRLMTAHEEHFAKISGDLLPLVAHARQLLSGGKRLRPLFCYWGWRGVYETWNPTVDADGDAPELEHETAIITRLGAALELFHAAALVHDDVIDNSDSRRGHPSAHRRFAALHDERAYTGSAEEFGTASAILLGDLLLAWSQQLFTEAVTGHPHAAEARARFDVMCTEVMAGQYLDIAEEHAWPLRTAQESSDQAMLINTYKSAKYSVEYPLLIGATVAGANAAQLRDLSRYGLLIGQAFQLRDDVLGVFGDPAVTGKPSGDDLSEGKRTLLIALTRGAVSDGVRHTIDELLGDQGLTEAQISMLQSAVVESGALDEVERVIERSRTEAERVLASTDVSYAARRALTSLANAATHRQS